MKYKLARQSISDKLSLFASRMMKKGKVYATLAKKSKLVQILEVSKEIEIRGLPKNLVLRKLKGSLGHGIFLHPKAKPILRGDVIGPYAGEVSLCPQNEVDDSDYMFSIVGDFRLTKKEHLLFDPKRKYHPRRIYSVDLDAHKKGNFTRFINHSEKPNVDAQLLRIPSNSLGLRPSRFEIVYVANKTIQPGEQILVCYEGEDKTYWGALKIKPFPMTPKTYRIDSSLKIISR